MSKPIVFLLHQNLVNSVSINDPHTPTLALALASGAAWGNPYLPEAQGAASLV